MTDTTEAGVAQEDRRSKPETLRLRDLSAGLTVDDLGASLAWYRDVVGFTVEETYERDGEMAGVSLVAGEVRLFLSQDDWAKGRDRVKGQGMGLYMSTVQDVDVLAERIRERGGELASEPADMPWGVRSFTLKDPDGFRLTISNEAG